MNKERKETPRLKFKHSHIPPPDMTEASAQAYIQKCIASVFKTAIICVCVYNCIKIISNNKHK